MKRIFVSGCYDIIHAGHVQFFTEARALGEHLTVCFASTEVLWFHKQRRSSLRVSSGSLPVRPLAWKYCGGGFGGYALYLCATRDGRDLLCMQPSFRPVEPFVK